MGNGPGKLSSNKMINIFPRASEMREWSGLPKGQAGIQVFFQALVWAQTSATFIGNKRNIKPKKFTAVQLSAH